MHFHHLHFYVEDAAFWRDWFIGKLAFRAVPSAAGSAVLRQAAVEIRLSEPASNPAVARYLRDHPPGLSDVAFATEHFDALVARSQALGVKQLTPVRTNASGQRWCQLQGWADIRHTLLEVTPAWVAARQAEAVSANSWLSAIDHAVINVPQGELEAAANWYQRLFGFVPGQQFEIKTAYSGLRSQVLVHPAGSVQLPLNEPSSANSQIQEFLHHNRGTGVQHVALRTRDAVAAIAHFRQQQLDLLDVPDTYYDSLPRRAHCPTHKISLERIRRQQLLLDWAEGGQRGLLLQTFTQPIFAEPTFFFEIIQRGTYRENGKMQVAQGFGEGNFQALFEAIESAQAARGSLS